MFRTPVLGVSGLSCYRREKALIRVVAHRALIVRKLKGLEDIIPYTSVHWEMLEKGACRSNLPLRALSDNLFEGWRFATAEEKVPGANCTPDPIHKNFTHLRDIYFDVDAEYKGRFTVPTLYDIKQKTIVSNEVRKGIPTYYLPYFRFRLTMRLVVQ